MRDKFINNNGDILNKPKNNQICHTKSILGGYEQICVWNESKDGFHPIIDGEVKKDITLKDSARYWKPIL